MSEKNIGVEAPIKESQIPVNELPGRRLRKLALEIDALAVSKKLDPEEMIDSVFSSKI